MDSRRKRTCITRSMTASMNMKTRKEKEEKPKTRERKKRKSSSTYYCRKKSRVKRRKSNIEIVEKKIELCDLSEEVLLAILENVTAPGLINTSKTCKLFNRLCYTDSIWKHRCKVDFNLETKWVEFSYLYLYEMFFKANTLRDDQNFFKPVSQLKTSVIVWYLTNQMPPCHVVGHLTASQVKSIWGITEEELEEMYFDDTVDRPEIFPLCHYEWSRLYQVFVKKHGGTANMQTYVLKRCYRNRQALEEHYKLSLHASRRQKWYQYLEDQDVGNREALKALTEHMPKVTYIYMLHQITAMYIDGSLKGGFQTVEAYAKFCAKFKAWMEEKSVGVWPPRLGEILAQDYRDALDYVNKSLATVAEERELCVDTFMRKACPFIEKLHEVWLWQNQHGTAYRKEHRSSMLVRRHDCYRKYLEYGRHEDFSKLRVYFERREVLSHWLKENLWLVSVLGDVVIRSLRPPMLAPDYTFPVLGNDPVACLVQRFLETGLYTDFNKVRRELSELASMQLHSLYKKAQALEHAVATDTMRPEMHFIQEANRRLQQRLMRPHTPHHVFYPPTRPMLPPHYFPPCNTHMHTQPQRVFR